MFFDPLFVICLAVAYTIMAAIIFHELGHLFYFQFVLKKRVFFTLGVWPGEGLRMRVGGPADYKDLATNQRLGVYLSGILSGLLPFIVLYKIFWPAALALLVLYLAGCRKDITNIWREWRFYV